MQLRLWKIKASKVEAHKVISEHKKSQLLRWIMMDAEWINETTPEMATLGDFWTSWAKTPKVPKLHGMDTPASFRPIAPRAPPSVSAKGLSLSFWEGGCRGKRGWRRSLGRCLVALHEFHGHTGIHGEEVEFTRLVKVQVGLCACVRWEQNEDLRQFAFNHREKLEHHSTIPTFIALLCFPFQVASPCARSHQHGCGSCSSRAGLAGPVDRRQSRRRCRRWTRAFGSRNRWRKRSWRMPWWLMVRPAAMKCYDLVGPKQHDSGRCWLSSQSTRP